MTLHLGPGMELPDDLATEAMAILGQRGSGKSNALVVLAEELHAAGIPWVAVDPKGDWYGIRSAADGTAAGLPVPVFGGIYGDVPLESGAGRYLADLIFDENLTCVLDVSTFSLAERARFLHALADRLYQRHHADPTVRHVLMEEAHLYLPQVVTAGEAQAVEAVSRMVLLGRTWGLGVTMASQRSARLNKNVLSQVGVLFAMCTSGVQDRAAIKAWVTEHNVRDDLVAALPTLAPGTGWLWAPQVLKLIEPVTFRRRWTFDSAATPKVGQKRRPLATMADVDLAAIKTAMAETIAKAEAADPKALRARIKRLEADLAAAQAAAQAVTGLSPDLETLLLGKLEAVNQAGERVSEAAGEMEITVDVLRAAVATATRPAPHIPRPAKPAAPVGASTPVRPEPLIAAAAAALDAGVWAGLGKAERAFVTVLAHHPAGLNRIQLALLSGYTIKSSSLSNGLGTLRASGWVNRGDPIQLTDAGRTLAGSGGLAPLPTGPELYDHWVSRLNRAERVVLDILVKAWPEEVTRNQLATGSGYSATSSSLSNALGRLRALELVRGWRAADDLMEAINR